MPDEIPLRAHCKAGRLAALKDLKLNQEQIAECLEEQMNWKPQPLLHKDSFPQLGSGQPGETPACHQLGRNRPGLPTHNQMRPRTQVVSYLFLNVSPHQFSECE